MACKLALSYKKDPLPSHNDFELHMIANRTQTWEVIQELNLNINALPRNQFADQFHAKYLSLSFTRSSLVKIEAIVILAFFSRCNFKCVITLATLFETHI